MEAPPAQQNRSRARGRVICTFSPYSGRTRMCAQHHRYAIGVQEWCKVAISFLASSCNGSTYSSKCVFTFCNYGKSRYIFVSAFSSCFSWHGYLVFTCRVNRFSNAIVWCIHSIIQTRFKRIVSLFNNKPLRFNNAAIRTWYWACDRCCYFPYN